MSETTASAAMDDLRVDPTLLIPGDALSVSYTRELEHSGPEAARHAPTHVELRFDTRACDELTAAQRAKLIADRELRADRRGTVRVFCREYRTRAQNLAGARQRMVAVLRQVLFGGPRPEQDAPSPADAPPERKKRGGGLIKRSQGSGKESPEDRG